MDLRDGSGIIGQIIPEKLLLESSWGKIEVPIQRIRTIEWDEKGSDAWLEATNGDRLQVKISAPSLRLRTSFGEANLPIQTVKRLTVKGGTSSSGLRHGLVGLWSGENNGRNSGDGFDGEPESKVEFGPGKVGLAFVLDGNQGGVRIPQAEKLKLQDFSIVAWVRRASVSIASHKLGGGQILAFGSGGYGFEVDDDGRAYLVKHDVSSVGSSFLIEDMNWHHIGVTKSGSAVVFYLDGMAYPADPYEVTFSFNSNAAIGARGDNLQNTFFGSIDEVAVYDSPLSASDITEIQALGKRGERILEPRPLRKGEQL